MNNSDSPRYKTKTNKKALKTLASAIVIATVMTTVISHAIAVMAKTELTAMPKAQQAKRLSYDDIITVNYTTDNGLPSNTVNCITKDSDGFLWLGTIYGLCSFDGTEFKPYVVRHNSNAEIPPKKILSIVDDKRNNLWIRTTDNRFYRFDKKTERFHDMYSDLKKVSANLRVIKLQAIANGRILVYTRNKCLYEAYADPNGTSHINPIYNSRNDIDRSTLKLRHNVVGENSKYIYWLGKRFEVCIVAKDGKTYKKPLLRTLKNKQNATCFYHKGRRLFIGTSNGKVYIINTNNGFTQVINASNSTTTNSEPVGTITQIGSKIYFSTTKGIYSAETSGKHANSHNVIAKLICNGNADAETAYADKNGTLWLYGRTTGISMFSTRSNKMQRFSTPQGTEQLNNAEFCEAADAQLFILLPSGCVMRYDRSNGKMQPFNSGTVYYDMAADASGLLWLASPTDALTKVRFPSRQLSMPYSTIIAADIRPSDSRYGVRSLLQTHDGDLWVGTRQRTVYRINTATKQLRHAYAMPDGNIYHMTEDSRGRIWFSSKGGGLTLAQPSSSESGGMKFTTFRHNAADKYSISDDRVYYTFEDSRHRIWVCTFGGGLNLVQQTDGRILFINKNNKLVGYPQGDLYMNTRQIAEDKNHTLWVATTDGLLSLNAKFGNPKDIKFNSFRSGNNPLVVDNDILSILCDSKGGVWLSVFGCGLNRIGGYDSNSGKLQLDNYADNGLQGNMVSTLVEDHNHRLWFTTENGLTSLSLSTGRLHSYGFLGASIHSSVDETTAIILENGEIAIGCREGLMQYSPISVESQAHSLYPTFITDFKVQNRSLDSFETPISTVCPKYAREIVLRHNQNMFSVKFATLRFNSGTPIVYAYILDGYEQQWHADGGSRIASYANIPPGTYTFKVKPLDGSSAGCSLQIKVLPPWWLTWWAFCIYALLLAAAAVAAVHIFLTMLRMRNEVYISNRLAELKIRFFTNISHELRTPLTLIKSPVDELRRHEHLTPGGRQYLNLIDRNATRMLQLVNQILDLRKAETGKMPLHLSCADMGAIVAMVCEEYSLAAKGRDITLNTEKPEEQILAWCDAEKIGVILNNLISNAFKYTPHGGRITISVSMLHDEKLGSVCRIRVEDNGTTIPPDKLTTIFERFSMAGNATAADIVQPGTGIGLSLAREFTTMHHGKIWAENPPQGGAAFIFEIPTSRTAYSNDTVETVFDDGTATATAEKTAGPSSSNAKPESGNNGGLANNTGTAEDAENEKPTLVLVEDNPDLREMLTLQLSPKYRIITAEDGAEGLDAVDKNHPDLVITDLMMPRMDGMELLKRIRNDFAVSHTPVIVLTAKDGDSDRMRLTRSGANAFMTKPFSAEMLAARIQQLLEEQRIFQRKMMLLKEPVTGNSNEAVAKTEAANDATAADYASHLAKEDMEFIARIRNIIEENMQNDDFNIDTIAETVGLSRSAFFKKLKSLTGSAPVDLVREMRLAKAENMLLSTNGSMSEVAYAVGFRDSSYFGKCFRKKFGMTPLEYRRSHKSSTSTVN